MAYEDAFLQYRKNLINCIKGARCTCLRFIPITQNKNELLGLGRINKNLSCAVTLEVNKDGKQNNSSGWRVRIRLADMERYTTCGPAAEL